MIIDLQKFVLSERRYWTDLESMLDRMEADPGHRLEVEEAKRFHYLYPKNVGGPGENHDLHG